MRLLLATVVVAGAAAAVCAQTLIEQLEVQRTQAELNKAQNPGGANQPSTAAPASRPASQPASASKPASAPASRPELHAARTINNRSYIGIVLKSREMAKFAATKSNLSAVGKAIAMYQATNDKYPPSLAALESEGLISASQLSSPVDPKYKYVFMAPKAGARAGTIVAYDPVSYNGQVAALMLDGSVQTYQTEDAFEQAVAAQ
jgi:hypothetical protein